MSVEEKRKSPDFRIIENKECLYTPSAVKAYGMLVILENTSLSAHHGQDCHFMLMKPLGLKIISPVYFLKPPSPLHLDCRWVYSSVKEAEVRHWKVDLICLSVFGTLSFLYIILLLIISLSREMLDSFPARDPARLGHGPVILCLPRCKTDCAHLNGRVIFQRHRITDDDKSVLK